MATGSGDASASHRAVCRQNNSWLRSVEAAIIRQRHDASPPNTIERPRPYCCTATIGNTAPPEADAAASTTAPGRALPSGAAVASAGSAAHFRRVSSPDAPSRMIGCVSPSGVTTRPLAGARSPATVARRPAAALVEFHRQNRFERRAHQPPLRERAAAGHEQAAAALGDEVGEHRPPIAREGGALDVRHDDGIVGIEIFAPGREACGQRGGTAALRLNQEGIAAVDVPALPNDGIDLEPRVGRPGPPDERVLEPGRALDDQQAALAAGRAHHHAACVVLGDGLSVRGGDFHGVHGRLPRVGKHGEPLLDRRPVGGRNHAAAFEQFPAGQDAQLKGIAPEPAADRRHLQVDGRVLEALLPRRDPEDFAIAQPAGGSDADREHGPGRDGVAGASGRRRRSGVAAVRQHDDAGHPLAAEAFADRRQPAGQVALVRARRQRVDRRRLDGVADGEQLRAELLRQQGQQVEAQQRGRARDPGVAVGIRHAHAARDVDEHGHDLIAIAGRRPQRNGTEQHEQQRDERGGAEPDEHGALRLRERRERAAVRGEHGGRQGKRGEHRQPPGRERREMHREGQPQSGQGCLRFPSALKYRSTCCW